jgi:hypothetical protein
MFRILAFFTATLLLFSTMPVSLVQQNSVQTQAEADALRDTNHDMKKGWWFMLGGVSSTAGCVLGCVGGCALGARLDPFGGSDVLPCLRTENPIL